MQDMSMDKSTTLIVQLGECCVKRSQLTRLVEVLLDKIHNGLGKLIICALPYSKSYSTKQNDNVCKNNLLIYNMTCRHSDILFFDTNKFISNTLLTRDTMYHSKRSLRIIAKLLAYNIFDPVISIITQLPDEPVNVVSSSTNQGITTMGSVNLNLN